ncbi:Abi family protein [Pedomonas sp. V897]|uniref:Abi family protein n=1 Tax=Pedomonas sp. V897 TaxID=3446482 RepID=UPI003EE201EE
MPLTPLQNAFSYARLGRYLDWANGNPAAAFKLYTLNSQLSEALYIPLQALELALRNRIHEAMSLQFGEDWLLAPGRCLHERQMQKVRRALEELTVNRKAHTPEQVLATLSFGFWTALLGKDYEDIWRAALYRIARKPDGRRVSRKSLSAPLATIRKLRNRIAHHEPILHYNLPRHHADTRQLIGWLSPEAEQWCAGCDRFPALYQENPVHLLLAA